MGGGMCFLFPYIMRKIMSVYPSFSEIGSQVSGVDSNFVLFGVVGENSTI